MKHLWIGIGVLVAVVLAGGYYFMSPVTTSVQPMVPNPPPPQPTSTLLVYTDSKYGFEFSLPQSWIGYSIIKDTWVGSKDGKTIATGTKILIRHPDSSTSTPRQDIPILVFSLDQWNDLSAEKFMLGAAPIGPSELARNTRYVFALPARYNYAFPPGFEEVEVILAGKPLHALP